MPPKRFLYARTMRYSPDWSPSKYSTVSTRCSSSRGPAIAPSLVTWPTTNVAQPVRFANSISTCVQSRICETLPANDSTSGSHIVWIESTTSISGTSRSSASSIARKFVSGKTSSDVRGADALRAQLRLRRRFLAAHVHRARAVARELRRELQQQRRLARAGRAAEQHEAARHDPAAEQRVELRHPGPPARDARVVDRRERHGPAGAQRRDGAPLRATSPA